MVLLMRFVTSLFTIDYKYRSICMHYVKLQNKRDIKDCKKANKIQKQNVY
jgi:hypothetical protein